jgi:hypothetical protein
MRVVRFIVASLNQDWMASSHTLAALRALLQTIERYSRTVGLLVIVAVGCGADRFDPVVTVTLENRAATKPTSRRHAVAASSSTGTADPDTDLCVDAFEAQVMVFPDETPAFVHPSRRSKFLALCAGLPDVLKRCLSPLHRATQTECNEARSVASPRDRFRISVLYTIITPDDDLSLPFEDVAQ